MYLPWIILLKRIDNILLVTRVTVVYTTSSTVVVLFVLAVLVILVLVQNVLQKQEGPLERERRSRGEDF